MRARSTALHDRYAYLQNRCPVWAKCRPWLASTGRHEEIVSFFSEIYGSTYGLFDDLNFGPS